MLYSVLLLSIFLSSGSFQVTVVHDTPNAVFSGLVTDRAGHPISGAEVRLINPGTGEIVSARSDENGRYHFASADATVDYTIAVRRLGFLPEMRPGIRVGTPESSAMSFALDSLKFTPSHGATGRTSK